MTNTDHMTIPINDVDDLARHSLERGSYFFKPSDMAAWGDKRSHFRVLNVAGEVYLMRTKNTPKKPACVPSEIGDVRHYNRDTGSFTKLPKDQAIAIRKKAGVK